MAQPLAAQEAEIDLTGLPELGTPDWLSDAITRPHANVATDASVPQITVLPLDAMQLDSVGLLPASITGLPRGLWGTSETETLARLMRAQPVQGLPAMQNFTEVLALAELDPPFGAPAEGSELFLARLDLLLDRGALDPAQALMERAGPTQEGLFRRWFDVSLLTDHSDRACAAMNANPDIAPTFPARIFCMARGGDWSAAALSLGTGEALGEITEEEGDLIARFLDPELFEDEPPLPPDATLTPLEFQMRMAIAQRPDMTGLPLAFLYADLSPLAGWRAQLDAAERLTRSGAIAPQEWLAIYTSQAPSASGAVWDRVEALQALDAALLAGDPVETSRRLAPAWAAMQEAGLEVAFADIYGERLLRTPLVDEAGILARRVGLLSPLYEQVAQSSVPQDETERFAFAIARGLPPENARDPLDRAIAAAFAPDLPPHRYSLFLENNQLGEALLRAALVLGQGAQDSDPNDVTDALVLFRSVGLEDVARRTALQLHLLQG
ncbi:hypothetical protein [Gymnodinialimonas hymeniacidonis]|uniref:hypothetical protein n=1 Tax=Gymnodinialimonas hymeniacidonis TaxID=3126508 RepID=UPI0034C616CC